MRSCCKKILASVICCSLSLALCSNAFAVAVQDEVIEAANYLRSHQIMVGNQNGDMMLEQGLTRAQMAVMLSRIIANPEHLNAEQQHYTQQCHFTDVPNWAKPYVGYCVANHLVAGYDNGLYGANDPVTPAAACTVMLRCLEDAGDDWSYGTACQKAVEIGIAPASAVNDSSISRGDMAILIYRVMQRLSAEDLPVKEIPEEAQSRYVPKTGDVISCQDGYQYAILDTSRYDNSMFASEPTQSLPTPTCDWSLLPQPELPDPEARHFSSGGKEILFLRNLYETRRMQYTLNNAIGANPETWKNGKPVTRADGELLVDIKLYVPNDVNVIPVWPWRSELITEYFNSCPPGIYYLEAWDVFYDGVFQHTEYYFYDE